MGDRGGVTGESRMGDHGRGTLDHSVKKAKGSRWGHAPVLETSPGTVA